MKIRQTTSLNCSVGFAWDVVLQSATLIQVAFPLARIQPSRKPFPLQWMQGETCFCKSFLFGFLPVGEREIYFEKVHGARNEIQTREKDRLIRQWDHLITLTEGSQKNAVYTDEVEIDAGLLTVPVWLWALWFYRHRQARLRKLIDSNGAWS